MSLDMTIKLGLKIEANIAFTTFKVIPFITSLLMTIKIIKTVTHLAEIALSLLYFYQRLPFKLLNNFLLVFFRVYHLRHWWCFVLVVRRRLFDKIYQVLVWAILYRR